MDQAAVVAEGRRGRYAAIAAIAAGVLLPAGLLWSQIVNGDRPEDDRPAELRFYDRHAGDLIASSVVRSVALLVMIVATVHLYRATKARSPQTPIVILVVAVLGPAALAIGGLVHDIGLAINAHDFARQADQSKEAADDVIKSPLQIVTIGLSLAGTLALCFWFVLGSLYAMRVGLLTRFIGVLGIVIGPLFLFPFPPIVMAFWLVALGALFLGHWPRGTPPAWHAGRAIPWPSAEERAVDERSGSRNGEVDAVGPGVRQGDAEATESGGSARRRRRRGR